MHGGFIWSQGQVVSSPESCFLFSRQCQLYCCCEKTCAVNEIYEIVVILAHTKCYEIVYKKELYIRLMMLHCEITNYKTLHVI